MRKWIKWLPLLLVGLMLLVQLSLEWISAAYVYGRDTGLKDAAGNKIGFGSPITLSLLKVAAPHIGLPELINQLNPVDIFLLLAVTVALAFCLPLKNNRLYRWHRPYLLAQVVLFPTGWLGVLLLLVIPFHIAFSGRSMDILDGELFEEGLDMFLVHGLWVAGCLWYAALSFLIQKTNPDLTEVPA